MISEKDKTVQEDVDLLDNSIVATNNDCQEKIDKLNNKLQTTANELEDVSALYARSVKEGLNKSKQIKELEEELRKCQQKNKQLEEQLKECTAPFFATT